MITIEFKDGTIDSYDDGAPSCDNQLKLLSVVGDEMESLTEEIPFDLIERVIFVP